MQSRGQTRTQTYTHAYVHTYSGMLLYPSTVTSSSYASSPVSTHVTAEGKVVCGVAVLSDQVFLVRKHTPEVEVYDTATLTLQRRLAVDELATPSDMTSCVKYNCLYVAARGYVGGTKRFVHRVELNGTTTKWPLNDSPNGLSVTQDRSNVIVTCAEVRKLKEYTTHGDLVREILLQEDMIHPFHAVQLTSGQLVVCHRGASDELDRVCLVDAEGRVTKYFDEQKGSAAQQMVLPIHLAVDQDGSILVVDYNKGSVLLLSASLDDVKELVPRRDVTKRWKPYRHCLDERNGVLYVAESEWEGEANIAGQLVKYKVKTI